MQILDLSVTRGATWNGMVLTLTDSLSAPVDLTDSIVTMDVKKDSCDDDYILRFSTEANTIVLTDAGNGVLSVSPVIIDVASKSYVYDLKIVLGDDTVIYPIKGRFIISNTVTR